MLIKNYFIYKELQKIYRYPDFISEFLYLMKKDKGLLYTILLFNLTFNITGTGVPRIHGELKKFGYDISQSTVQRYIPKLGRRTTGQNWKTFLKNHSKEIDR